MYGFIYTILFIAGLTAAFYIAYRYTMTEMVYIVEGDTFSITETVGRKTVTVCALNLSTAKALMKYSDYKKDKKAFGMIDKKYNYCQNMCADCWCYISEFNGLTTLVKFEPNDIFAAKMKDSIEQSKNDEE